MGLSNYTKLIKKINDVAFEIKDLPDEAKELLDIKTDWLFLSDEMLKFGEYLNEISKIAP